MTQYSNKPEDHYKYREDFRSIEGLQKMDLPPDSDSIFEEEQSFDQAWIWLLLALQTLLIMVPVIFTGQGFWVILVAAGAMALSLALMGSIKLRTRIDDEGVYYRMIPFHWNEKMIPWSEIDSVFVRQYSPIKEYGGWGIRFGRNGTAFNIRGNKGLQIVKKNGKRILLGTDKPDEIAKLLETKPLIV